MAHRNTTNKKKHPKIIVSKFGKVTSREVDYTLPVVEDCYVRLEPHEVGLVDLYFFEKSSSMDSFMAREFREVGVVSGSFDELFFAMHDAYRGTSRIILCLERMKKLPELAQLGGIRHEVGHSVLHGSLLYYLLPLPLALLDLVNRFGISRDYASNLLYLISIAVKDYEVSRLMYQRHYVEDQIAYAKHLLTITESDKLSWQMAKGRPSIEILCLVSYLKASGSAAPFLFDKTFGEDMNRLLTESLSHLPSVFSTSLLNIIMSGLPSLGTNTLSNVNYVARLVTESLVKPLLLR